MRRAAFALLFAAAPAWAADPIAGEAAYQRACARCHRDPSVILTRLGPDFAASDSAARAARLEAFIAAHHSPGAQAADIAAWLAAR